MLEGNVLVTGGAGYLARGIYRRAQREGWSCRFTALSRDDAKHAALQKRFPHVETVIGDVGLDSVEYLTALMRGFDTVIHAAASKYVDRGERATAVPSIVQTNVIGTQRIAEAARRARVERAVVISTDKACQPVNNYGATKFLAERIFQAQDALGPTRFTAVRYGNVIGSTGSVLTLFRDWAARGEPIRLTDPQMTRFWMTIDEAVAVVVEALADETPGGYVMIPEMRAMTMLDLTRMALGFAERGPLPEGVEVIGIRPGEKRHEAIIHEQESVRCTWHRDGYYYLAPPDFAAHAEARAFAVTSREPPGGWWGIEEIRCALEDAGTV